MKTRSGRGRTPQADMDAARVVALIRHLEERGVDVWVDGGWGIDAALGRQTRPHDDLDLVAPLDATEALVSALGEWRYEIAGGAAPSSFELVDTEGHQVDVHPVRFTASGDGVYRREGGQDWTYPASGFAGSGYVLGHLVRCFTPEVQMLCHTTGYALDGAHRRDVARLSERFGIPIPEYESAPD